VTHVIDPTNAGVATETDLPTALQRVFQESTEPLTVSKVRAALPARFRSLSLEELGETLNRQVAANVLYQFPKYRSQQDRYWDRPMPVHIAGLLQVTLQEEGPLGWSELRRKLPAYAQDKAEGILQEQIGQGKLHRHPRVGRGSERYGVRQPDPKDYLRTELKDLFVRLEPLGFTQEQLRNGALELLHEEEWKDLPKPGASSEAAPPMHESQPVT
jgi:hypothetical protein